MGLAYRRGARASCANPARDALERLPPASIVEEFRTVRVDVDTCPLADLHSDAHYTRAMLNLGSIALELANVDEGVACAGTALESRSYRVNKKNFLFLSANVARFKLDASSAEAKGLGCEVGANGWVKLSLDALPPASVVRRWIAESHALCGGASGRSGARARAAAPKRSTKKRSS